LLKEREMLNPQQRNALADLLLKQYPHSGNGKDAQPALAR